MVDDELGGVAAVVVFVFVVVFVVFSFSFTTVEAGFTMVVLFSVFFSAGAGDEGATTSVFCSHAPRSAALARMQINFFIVLDWLPILGLCLNRTEISFRPCRS